MNKYLIIVVPAGKKLQANLYADGINEAKPKNTGNEKTFTVPLWPLAADTNKDPASHYWCCWWMSDKEQQRAAGLTEAPAFGGKIYEWPPTSPDKVLAELGLKIKDLTLLGESNIKERG